MTRERALERLHKRRIVVAQRTASAPDRTAWVGIYPLDPADPSCASLLRRNGIDGVVGQEARLYRIRWFEIADELRNVWFGEDALERASDAIVVGDDQLFAKLSELEIPLDNLADPAFVDYPL